MSSLMTNDISPKNSSLKVVEFNQPAVDKSSANNKLNNLLAAYALLRKVLSEDTILSSKLNDTFNKLQCSLNDMLKDQMDSIKSDLNKMGKIADEIKNNMFPINLATGLGSGLLIAGLFSGNVVLMGLGIVTNIVSNAFALAENCKKLQSAELQYKVAGVQGDMQSVQASINNVSSTSNYFMTKLKQLMQTQSGLNETLNSAISDVAKAIQELSQRVK